MNFKEYGMKQYWVILMYHPSIVLA